MRRVRRLSPCCRASLGLIVTVLIASAMGRAQSLTPTLTVTNPAAVGQNQNFVFAITVAGPVGSPTPTGSVIVYDAYSGNSFGTATLANGAASLAAAEATPGEHSIYAVYSGDGNYYPTYFYGSFFAQAGLVTITPAAITAGSADTTITVVGQNFTNTSIVQLAANTNLINLATTYVSPTRLTAVVPAVQLAAPVTDGIQVSTGGAATNSVQLVVYTKYADTVLVSSAINSVVYGQTPTLAPSGTVTRGAPADAAVPSGSLAFSINGTQIGTGQLTQAATAGAYQPGAPFAVSSDSTKMLTGDFNRDGYPDLLSFTAGQGPLVQIFFSLGPNSFQTESDLFVSCTPADMAVADLNNDGNPDIAIACQNPPAGTPYGVYLLGNGDGTFQAPVTFASTTNSDVAAPTQVAAGDFNGDGVMDLALLDASGDIQVFTGSQPFGTFTALNVGAYPNFGGTPLNAVAADFNQDGKSDVAFLTHAYNPDTGITTGYLFVLTSNGDGTFASQQQTFTTPAFNFQNFAITDVNGDGYPDVVVADPGASSVGTDTGQLLIYQNNGAGTLNAAVTYAAAGASSVAGLPFPIVGKPAAPAAPAWSIFFSTLGINGQISVTALQQSSPGNFTAVFTNANVGYEPYLDAGFIALPMVAADFNGDGYLDLAMLANGQNGVGSTSFTPLFYGNDSAPAGTSAPLPLLNAGSYTLVAAYPGDTNYAANSGNIPFTVTPAAPTAGIAGPAAATAGEAVTFVVTVAGVAGGAAPTGTVQLYSSTGGPLGGMQMLIPGPGSSTAQITTTALPVGSQLVSAVYSGDVNYSAATSPGTQIAVSAASNLSLSAINPTTGYLGAAATAITLTGTGFTGSSVAQLNGAAIATAFVSPTQLRATIPASFFLKVQTGTVTVTNPGNGSSTPGLGFSVIPPPVQVVLSGPPTASPDTQPAITFQLPNAYPVDITGTFTLTVQPAAAGGPVDPAVQFSTGGDTFTFTLPANTTVTPAVQLQAGTVSGAITVALTLEAGGAEITPAGLQPVVIQVPAAAPTINSLTLARNGTSLTVTIRGFSNTREMKSAVFAFTPASGSTITNPNLTVDLGTSFATWYGQTTSDQFGSDFTYVQTFLLTDDASTIGGVTATLVNSIGTSNTKSAQ